MCVMYVVVYCVCVVCGGVVCVWCAVCSGVCDGTLCLVVCCVYWRCCV